MMSRALPTSWSDPVSPVGYRRSHCRCANWSDSVTAATSPKQTRCLAISVTNFRPCRAPSTNFSKPSQTQIRSRMKKIYTPTRHKKILIVDDDAGVTSVYKSKFESERYRVEVVSPGERALQLLKTELFDLVLLDFSMPGMNGAEVLKTIRSQPGGEALPVIAFTNSYLPGAAQAASDSGATRCVRKSNYTPQDMLVVVRELLEKGHDFSGNAKPGAVPSQRESISDFETEKANLTADFLAGAPKTLGAMRLSHHALLNSEGQDIRLAELCEMHRQASFLAGAARIAGFRKITQLVSALDALFIRLSAKPANTTPSVMRTIGQAIDLLSNPLDYAAKSEVELPVSPSILVVDEEIISREAI